MVEDDIVVTPSGHEVIEHAGKRAFSFLEYLVSWFPPCASRRAIGLYQAELFPDASS